MKTFLVLTLVSLAAAAQTGVKTTSASKMLEDFEREEWVMHHPGEPMPPPETMPASVVRDRLGLPQGRAASSAVPTKIVPAANKARLESNFTSHALTTRFLFLKISDSLLRFHVDANLGDDELETIIAALGSSCLKSGERDLSCDTKKQDSIVVDKAFLANAKLSQSQSWSREPTPRGLHWKLTCASGGDDCFDRITKPRAFKLTTNRRAAVESRILAHGFESQATRAIAKKTRSPASATSQKALDRVYVTRTTSERIKLLPKGTL